MFMRREEGVVEMKKLAVVNRNVCVACGACTGVCPRNAISVYRGCYAVVSLDKCVGCGLCGKTCPAGCIRVEERSAVQ